LFWFQKVREITINAYEGRCLKSQNTTFENFAFRKKEFFWIPILHLFRGKNIYPVVYCDHLKIDGHKELESESFDVFF
jgi:hypothetical protein